MITLHEDFSNITEFENAIKEKGDKPLKLWKKFLKNSDSFYYHELEKWLKLFEPFGITFDYYLDAQPYDFKII